MSKGTPLGLGSALPGPYVPVASLYDKARWSDRSSFVRAYSGTREGTFEGGKDGATLGQRGTVYETQSRNPGQIPPQNYTNLAHQVEQTLGQCQPRPQDPAPAYGPPGAPNVHTSYPVRAQFENRQKWTGAVEAAFARQGREEVHQGVPPPPLPPSVETFQNRQPILLGSNLLSSGEDQYSHRMTYLNRGFNEDDGEILIQPPPSLQTHHVGSYSDELFKTPLDNTENKISTGVMLNPYTGEMFETFENEMPPPNTDQSIPADRFDIVNPKLLAMHGGFDQNRTKPKKKEVCLDVPGSDFGRNVWGDQLYEEERRQRMAEIVQRDLWNRRDGDHSTVAAVAKEKPAGFVGLHSMYRALPYLPPVQNLDNKGYLPLSDYTHSQPEAAVIKGEVIVTKPDLTTAVYQQPAGPLHDQEAEYVVSQFQNRPTWRGGVDTYYEGTPFLSTHGTAGPQQTHNKPTLKEFMEQSFEPGTTTNHVMDSGGGVYVVTQTHNKPTLKEQMEQAFDPGTVTTQALESGGGGYVLNQTQNKATLKEFMEQRFEPTNAQTATLETGSMSYVVTQTQNRPTLREFMETEFPVQVIDPSRPENGYVLTQTENKPTLKTLMQQTFDPSNLAAESTGSYIEFQGPLEEVRRAYYEKMPAVGRPAEFHWGVGGDYVGNGLVTSMQNRGTASTDWVEPSLVPQDAGDTHSRWMSQQDKDTKREFVPNVPAGDLASSFQAVAPRLFGAITARCNADLHSQVDDEFSWTHGFAPQIQDVVTG